MKALMIRFAVAASLVFGLSANAADAAPRKEAVLDTGKGGLHLVVSVPGFANGPYDSAKNPGPKNIKHPDGAYSEVMFNAQVGETGVVVYQVSAINRFKSNKGDQALTPDVLAAGMLKEDGFTLDRATKIDSPQVSIPGATVVTYKASGYSVFDGVEKKTGKVAIIVTAVSLPGQTQGYVLSAEIVEKNVSAFDADPEKFEKMARGGFKDMLKNTSATLN